MMMGGHRGHVNRDISPRPHTLPLWYAMQLALLKNKIIATKHQKYWTCYFNMIDLVFLPFLRYPVSLLLSWSSGSYYVSVPSSSMSPIPRMQELYDRCIIGIWGQLIVFSISLLLQREVSLIGCESFTHVWVKIFRIHFGIRKLSSGFMTS